jgi:hypothetical protein
MKQDFAMNELADKIIGWVGVIGFITLFLV